MFTLDELQSYEDSTIIAKPVSTKKKSWRGHYCCVPLCHNSSGCLKERKELGLPKISFHAFPDVRSVKGKQWIKLIRRDPGSNFIITKNTKICSEHFVLGDFCSRSGRRYLKQNAVPSVFPWKQRQ